ncbi:MAG: lipocalin family protein [Alistipes sp.]|nr:lipocalin family protein [Alistipes sp.]
MKNLKIWSLALALLMVVTGCEEKAATDNFKAGATNIVGEWQLTKWDGEVAPYDVYVNFDGVEVVIYQRVYSSLFEQFTGTYTLNGSKLTGMYNDGTEFGPYRAEVSVDGETMRLHKTDGEREIMGVYTKTTIPEWVKTEAGATRAAEGVPFL